MMEGPTLEYQAYIRTDPHSLWKAMTDPEQTKKYFYGLAVQSDFKAGSPIKHLFPQGNSQIEGKVIECDPGHKLVHTFATTGVSDPPSRVTYEIQPMGEVTLLTLTHDDFGSETQTFESVRRGWNPVISGLKTLLETGHPLDIPIPEPAEAASS